MRKYCKPTTKVRPLETEGLMDVIVSIPDGEGSGDPQHPIIFDSKEETLPRQHSVWDD